MDADTKVTLGTVSVVAVVLITLGVIFFETGSRLAAFLALASPLLIAAGVFIFKRGLVRLERYSLPVQLKVRSLNSFVDEYNDLESTFQTASRTLRISRTELPSLDLLRQPIERFIEASEDTDRPLVAQVRGADNLGLAEVERLRRALPALRAQGEEVILRTLQEHRAAASPGLKDLHRMGLTRMTEFKGMDEAVPVKSRLESYSSELRLVSQECAENLQKDIEWVGGYYRDISDETQLMEHGNQAAAAGDYRRALELYVQCGASLEKEVGSMFASERNAVLKALVVLQDSPGIRMLDEGLQRRIGALTTTAESFKSPLQLHRVTELRETLVKVAADALADLETKAEESDPDRVGILRAYLDRFSGPGPEPGDPAQMEQYLKSWRDRFEHLAEAMNKLRLDSSNETLYRRLEPRILELLQSQGSVTAEDLKLKKADAIFDRFCADHSDAKVLNGKLVPAGEKAAARKKGRAANA